MEVVTRRTYGSLLIPASAQTPQQGFGSFPPAAAMHDHTMDSRLNALIVEARRQETALEATRPRLDTTPTPALAPAGAQIRLRRAGHRLLRLAHARGAGR